MSKSEISEKELEKIKKRCKELVPRPCYWRDKGNSQCDFIPFVRNAVPRLITVLEHKKAELDAVKKENGKLRKVYNIAERIYKRLCWEKPFGTPMELNRWMLEQKEILQQALRELDNETK